MDIKHEDRWKKRKGNARREIEVPSHVKERIRKWQRNNI